MTRPPRAGALAEPLAPASADALGLLRVMMTARAVDVVETELVDRGEGFFHLAGSGHEASAVLAAHLGPQDWLHVHYRDKALMIARGFRPIGFLDAVLCNADSSSAGRQMSAHHTARHLGIITMSAPVGNSALQAVGVAREVADEPGAPVVLCSFGDGTSQQGEVLEAIGEAVRRRLPVLFWIEDNGLAISTRTRGATFHELPGGPADEYLGIPIRRVDGRDPLACDRVAAEAVRAVREGREPAICVMSVERLTSHTNADDERVYRDAEERAGVRAAGDPIRRLAGDLRAAGVPQEAIDAMEAEVDAEVRAAAERALGAPDPEPATGARAPFPAELVARAERSRPTGPLPAGEAPVTMLEALRGVLGAHLARDPRVSVYGEDIEDPKGDVFGLTRGLSSAHPGRVENSPLSESTIVGVSVGRALAGGRPVACVQFADFMPLAFNQILTELATIHWRSDGDFAAPVVVMAPCGGYRPGLGPFHAATYEATLAHAPGLDVVMPSTAADAAGLLNAALASDRPTIFLYPKTCLNDPALAAPPDAVDGVVLPGVARLVSEGDDLTIVSWGATVPICARAVAALEGAGVGVDLVDLRSISPWDADAVARSVRRTGRLLVVHEDSLTGGFGAEVVATACERVPDLAVRRVTRADTHVPCNYANQLAVLPSLRGVLEAAAALVGVEVRFASAADEEGVMVVEAAGSSPADQQVVVLEWYAADGDRVVAGDLLAECEADKAAFELRSPASGVVGDLLPPGEVVAVGTPIARIRLDDAAPAARRRIPRDPVPEVTRPEGARPARARRTGATPEAGPALVAMGRPTFAAGGRMVGSEELAAGFPGRSAEDIVRRTGIERRPYLAEGETIVDLAARAAGAALAADGLTAADLDAIYVATGTPPMLSPTLACLLHAELAKHGPAGDPAACDISAACSGYLYALQAAYDLLQQRPESAVLVVTAEAMSRYLDPEDFDTAVLFGDAATATVVRGPARLDGAAALLHRPVLSARGEDGTVLSHGAGGTGVLRMDGRAVFALAVREMLRMLRRACGEGGVAVEDLAYVIPHQANGRIISAIQSRSGLPADRFVLDIDRWGNTSSSSIPIALSELLAGEVPPRGRAGLVAFGAGFTSAAAVIDLAPGAVPA